MSAVGTEQEHVRKLEKRLARALYIAEHLFQMIPRDVWRAEGGDDGQGHYEGDYWAEQTRDELDAIASGVEQS